VTKPVRYAFLAAWLSVVAGALYLYFFERAFIERELADAMSVGGLIAATIYVLLGAVRAFTLIPATLMIVVGLPFFRPWPLFLMTLIGILITSALFYWFSEALQFNEEFERKHPKQIAKMRAALQKHQLPIILLWSFFPLLPTDLICYVCGALKINFTKTMVGVGVGEGAICAIYIFFGDYFFRGYL
jgi:uncharacterized membrane protein YdjX (TVP38/TMEM64 family)